MSGERLVEAFSAEFIKNAHAKGEVIVDIVGSAIDGTWQKGSSDVDVVVYLRGKNNNIERDLLQLYFQLDSKHGTQLQSLSFIHPPVIFVRNTLEQMLIAKIFSRENPKREILKTMLKKVAPPIRILVPFIIAYGKYLNLAFIVMLFLISLGLRTFDLSVFERT